MKCFLFVMTLGLFMSGCQNFKYYDPSKPHRGNTQFYNNYDNEPKASFWKWQWDRLTTSTADEPEFKPEILRPDLPFLNSNRTETTFTWIGHATALLQVHGLNILIDPVFSDRVSPFGFLGPKRLVLLPMSLAELPPLDVVVISHSHYDHLDLPTLKELEKKGQGKTVFLTPLGTKDLLESEKIQNVKEFDWWQEFVLDDVRFVFTPSQHWTRRGLFDTNQSLWGGWFVQNADWKFLYTGDTGYSKDFQDIRSRLGSVDVAMMPIGAYEPRWFMKQQHINPDEAIQVHKDLKAKLSIGVHWGTFRLSDEPMAQPPQDLNKLIQDGKINSQEFHIPKHGETLRL